MTHRNINAVINIIRISIYTILEKYYCINAEKSKYQNSYFIIKTNKYFKKVTELAPKDYNLIYTWGTFLAEQALSLTNEDESDLIFETAYEKFKTALEIRPDFFRAFYGWGYYLYYQALNKRDEEAKRILLAAEEKLKKSLEKNNNSYQAYYYLGKVITEQAKLEKIRDKANKLFGVVIDKYKIALQLKPGLIDILNSWGNLYYEQAIREKNLEADSFYEYAYLKYDEALKIKYNYETLYNWGSVLANQAKTKKGDIAERLFHFAYQKFQAALNLNPNLVSVLLNWGFALEDHAKVANNTESDKLFNLAYQKYQEALRIDPNNYNVLLKWGITLIEQAKLKSYINTESLFKEAKEKFLEAEPLKPENASYLMAYLNLVTGNESGCKKWLEKSLKIDRGWLVNYLLEDPHFDSIKEKEWFKILLSNIRLTRSIISTKW